MRTPIRLALQWLMDAAVTLLRLADLELNWETVPPETTHKHRVELKRQVETLLAQYEILVDDD